MSRISELPIIDPATLDGSELVPIVKDGQTGRTNIAALVPTKSEPLGFTASGAPIELGIRPVARSTQNAETYARFVASIVDGPCSIDIRVDGFPVHAAINAVGDVEQHIDFTIPAGANVDFFLTSGAPTFIMAYIDGGAA